jgi:hypothetical protein
MISLKHILIILVIASHIANAEQSCGFKCNDGTCLESASWRCDNSPDCPDGSVSTAKPIVILLFRTNSIAIMRVGNNFLLYITDSDNNSPENADLSTTAKIARSSQ